MVTLYLTQEQVNLLAEILALDQNEDLIKERVSMNDYPAFYLESFEELRMLTHKLRTDKQED